MFEDEKDVIQAGKIQGILKNTILKFRLRVFPKTAPTALRGPPHTAVRARPNKAYGHYFRKLQTLSQESKSDNAQ